jgi:hypothetical protein
MAKKWFASLASGLLVAAACSGPTSPSPPATSLSRSISTAAGGPAGMNEIWVTAVSVDEHAAASSALAFCDRQVGTPCTFNVVCSGLSEAWAGLSRQLVDRIYSYRLVCDRTSSEEVMSSIACDGCEVLWGPRAVH